MAARLTAQQKLLRTIKERDFQSTVQELMTVHGWKWYHPTDNRPVNGRIQGIVPGFPDLIALRGAQIIVAELKTEIGKTSPDQDAWLDAFDAVGADTYVWRPRDLAEINDVLR